MKDLKVKECGNFLLHIGKESSTTLVCKFSLNPTIPSFDVLVIAIQRSCGLGMTQYGPENVGKLLKR